MNKSKIEWCDSTWNPVTGCFHGCEYCYARRIAERFGSEWFQDSKCVELDIPVKYPKGGKEVINPYPHMFNPTFHKYRLNEPKQKTKPSKIFVCSMADLFGDWVPDKWIQEIYMTCQEADQHQYLFLTKNPKGYSKIYRSELDYRYNMWFGITATNSEDFMERGYELCCSTGINFKFHANRFISFEPLLGEINKFDLQNLEYFDWVIVGAQTGPGAVPPKSEWVQSILDQCRAAGIPIFLKDNLKWPEKIQDFPKEMK